MKRKYRTNTMSNQYGKSSVIPQYIAALSACLGSVAAGTALAWSSNIGKDLEESGYNDMKLTADEISWIGSLLPLGAVFMCFVVGPLCDLIGRKITMLALIAPFTLGWCLIIFANSVGMIYAGRFIVGMAGGSFCISAPMYTSEIAQKEIRGILGTFFQLLLVVGILIANVAGKYMYPQDLSILCGTIPLVFGLVFFWQPESPVYNLKKGKEEEALKCLKKLRGKDYDAKAEISDIKKALEEEKKLNISFGASFKKRATKISLLICFGLMFFQQLSGINAVIFYTGDIFRDAGGALNEADSTILVGAIQVVATLVAAAVIDKFGRKILLLISAALMTLCLLAMGVFFSLKETGKSDDIGFIPVAALCIFIAAFSLGFGPIPWLMSSEVFPPEIKSIASSSAGTFNWFLAFLMTRLFKPAKDEFGAAAIFYFFTGIMAVSILFIIFVCAETKGKTLDQIQNELNKGKKDESGESGVVNRGYTN